MSADERNGARVVDETIELWSKRITKTMSFAELRRAERAARVLRLYNRGIDVDDIAERENLSPGQVAEDIRAAMRSYIDEAAEETVARHRSRMDDVMRTMFEIMCNPAAKDADRARAGTAIVRTLANEARLLGINAPQRLELGGANGDDFAAVAADLLGKLGRSVPPVLAAAAARGDDARTIVDADVEPVDPDRGLPGGPDDQEFGGLDPWVD